MDCAAEVISLADSPACGFRPRATSSGGLLLASAGFVELGNRHGLGKISKQMPFGSLKKIV
jgi:hypothetical protein